MKSIYGNEIVEVKVNRMNYESNYADATINNRKSVTLLVYTYYEFEAEPLLFIELPKTHDGSKLMLISKYEEWYGNTGQDTTDWALEFAIFVRMILINYLIVNPRYLELDNSLLTEILDIVTPGK